jgi:toxin ParE1/3/4
MEDLEDITDYVSEFNPRAARTLFTTLFERCLSLARHPRRGRLVRTRSGQTYRRLVEGQYAIIYEVSPDRVVIAHVRRASSNYLSELQITD